MKRIVIGSDGRAMMSCTQVWDNGSWGTGKVPRITPCSRTICGYVYYMIPSNAKFERL